MDKRKKYIKDRAKMVGLSLLLLLGISLSVFICIKISNNSWGHYINNKFGYSLEYPKSSEFTVSEQGEGDQLEKGIIGWDMISSMKLGKLAQPTINEFYASTSIKDNPDALSVENYVNKQIDTASNTGDSYPYTNKENILVNGENGYLVTNIWHSDVLNNTVTHLDFYIALKNNKILMIYFGNFEPTSMVTKNTIMHVIKSIKTVN